MYILIVMWRVFKQFIGGIFCSILSHDDKYKYLPDHTGVYKVYKQCDRCGRVTHI